MSHASQPPKTVGYHAFLPDAQALLLWLSKVKQAHYYGMEPCSAAGSPGSLGIEPERGS